MADSPLTDTTRSFAQSDVDLAQLLQLSGRRSDPPADRLERLRLAALMELRATVRQRSRRRWLTTWIPASAAAAILFATWALRGPAPVPSSGILAVQVASIVGDVRASEAGGTQTKVLNVGDRLLAGTTVETGPTGRAALTLADGASIRLDRSTRIAVQADSVLVLNEGALYADAGAGGATPSPHGGALEIRTPFGVVSDIGTQFEVRLDAAALRIRVREGQVALAERESRLLVGLGEGLTVARGRQPARSTVPLFGDTWSWTSEVVPPFDLEGRSVPDFAAWVSREQGWHWRFADQRAARHGERIRLHGSVKGLTPEQALAVVLPTAAMTHEVRHGALVIKLLENGR